MADFLICLKAGNCFIGAVEAQGNMEDALSAAKKEVNARDGKAYSLSTDRKEPITEVLICEVVKSLVPDYQLIPKV